ncbi:hypothetical protein ACRN92_16880, partial [Shewanella ulleungensis]
IDICAYAVMSNHLHVVLKVDADKVKQWSDKEVLIQWHKGFKGTLLTHKFLKGEDLNQFERQTVNECITEYHKRLIDISWFMRSLSEPIARMANKEDIIIMTPIIISLLMNNMATHSNWLNIQH